MKKVTLEDLKASLGELEAKKQTPEVMAEVDALKEQIATKEAEEKALEEEIAKAAEEKAAKAKAKADAKAAKAGESKKIEPAFTHEEWRLEKKITNGKTEFSRAKMLKRCILSSEHEDILNEQKENTLLEYVPISKEE